MDKIIALSEKEKQLLRQILKGEGGAKTQNKALISSILEKTNTENLLQSAIICLKENIL